MRIVIVLFVLLFLLVSCEDGFTSSIVYEEGTVSQEYNQTARMDKAEGDGVIKYLVDPVP